MAPGSCTTWQSPCVNFPIDFIEQNELANAQGSARRSDASSNKTPILFETPTPPLAPPPSKDLFSKFIKVFIETTQAQALAEPQKRLLKAKTPEIYLGKFHMEYYHFYHKCEEHFETSGNTRTNRTPFVTSFLHGFISLK